MVSILFFACFQLHLAVPIPKLLDRTKQASFPRTLVLDSIQVQCQQHATTKSLFPAMYHIVSLFRMPVWFTNFWCSSKNFVVISARHSYAQLRLNFQIQAAFQSNVQWHQNILDCQASSLSHHSLFKDVVRVYILPNYNHE